MTAAVHPSAPSDFQAPVDTAVLARMANALFKALPSQVPGTQAPVNIAPPGSPLASPAGLGPSVPGTPIPQGQVPGTNLLPASPTPVLSLVNRVPALVPHAEAGNGVPDSVFAPAPGYEPRSGIGVLGVPDTSPTPPYYFLANASGHPSPGGGPQPPSEADALETLARLPFASPEPPRAVHAAPVAAQPVSTPSADPRFYFVDAVVLPNGLHHPRHAWRPR